MTLFGQSIDVLYRWDLISNVDPARPIFDETVSLYPENLPQISTIFPKIFLNFKLSKFGEMHLGDLKSILEYVQTKLNLIFNLLDNFSSFRTIAKIVIFFVICSINFVMVSCDRLLHFYFVGDGQPLTAVNSWIHLENVTNT